MRWQSGGAGGAGGGGRGLFFSTNHWFNRRVLGIHSWLLLNSIMLCIVNFPNAWVKGLLYFIVPVTNEGPTGNVSM